MDATGVVSEAEEHRSTRDATSLQPPGEVFRDDEQHQGFADITTKFDCDEGFELSPSVKADYLAQIGVVVDATGGEDGSEAAAERAVPVFGEERSTGSTYALEPSSPREWQAGEQVQPAGHDGMAVQLEGRAAGGPVQSARLKVGRADAGAHEEQEDQEDQAVAVVATRPVEELAERLSPLLFLLSKWRILSLRRGFDKIDSVGLEATVHPVVLSLIHI